MIRFIALRLGRALLTIAMVVTFAFVVLRLSGDPAMLILNVDAPAEAIAAFRHSWGLDQPLWVQYFDYCANILRGDLGQSMRDGRPAASLVWERVPATLALTVPALLIKVGVGIPAGIQAALHRGSWVDRLVMAAAVAGFTVPSFVLGLVLVLVFAVGLGWLPSGGTDSWLSPVLPVITLGVGGAAILARFTRSAMLEVLGQPYIRTASAKGVPWRTVVRGARAAERRDPHRHDRWLHGRQPNPPAQSWSKACSVGPASAGRWWSRCRTATSPSCSASCCSSPSRWWRRTWPWTCCMACSTPACGPHADVGRGAAARPP